MRGFHFSLAVIDHYAKKYWRPHKRQKSKKFNFCKKIYHVKKLSNVLSDTNTISCTGPFWKSSSEKESNDKLEGSTSEAEPAKTDPTPNNEVINRVIINNLTHLCIHARTHTHTCSV